jgi:thiamine phosphate synthase YjbQ (UPF0047 family)
MKTYRKELWFEAKLHRQLFRMTPQIQECVRESGIAEGLALVNAMRITASEFDGNRRKRVLVKIIGE